jgi:hypothetical protein
MRNTGIIKSITPEIQTNMLGLVTTDHIYVMCQSLQMKKGKGGRFTKGWNDIIIHQTHACKLINWLYYTDSSALLQ